MRIDRLAFAVALARADISSKELAALSGVSQSTVSAIKCGRSCSIQTARKLANVLGEEIFGTEIVER